MWITGGKTRWNSSIAWTKVAHKCGSGHLHDPRRIDTHVQPEQARADTRSEYTNTGIRLKHRAVR